MTTATWATQWARDDQGDMVFPSIGNGSEAIETDPARCAQIKLTAVLEFVQGEWFLDQLAGFPWFALVWSQKSPNVVALRHALSKYLLGTPPVVAVTDAAIAVDANRNARYAFQARIATGQLVSVP